MSKSPKINLVNCKTEYYAGDIKNKGQYLNVSIRENGITINATTYSDIGLCLEEAFLYEDRKSIIEFKTFIIQEDFVIVEITKKIN